MPDKTRSRRSSLRDDDIVTKRAAGRRRVLGLMAVGSVGAALVPGRAAAADADNGAWTDVGSCPRGTGGTRTGVTDADTGNIDDRPGFGRGRPRC